jgi:putative copper resistance protein D
VETLLIVSRFAAHLVAAFVVGWLIVRRQEGAPRRQLAPAMAGLAAITAGLIATQIVAAAAIAAPEDGCFAPGPLRELAAETWGGRVLMLRAAVFLGLALVLAAGRARRLSLPLLLGLAGLLLAPFSGHAVSVRPAWASLALHGVHVAAALAWIGGVMVLAAEAAAPDKNSPADALRLALAGFSPVAVWLVALAVMSGVAAAVLQVAGWPALLGSAYGQLLLLKVVLALGVALAAAGWLRRRYLPAGGDGSPRLALAIEASAGLAMIGLAALLSQSVPGRHADILWPLPFRINPALLWADGALVWAQAVQLGLGGALLAAAGLLAVLRHLTAGGIVALVALLVGGVGLTGLVTPAYPTTYAVSPSRFAADNLFNATHVYAAHCVDCHGPSGRGDGEGMVLAGSAAADLTGAHTGDHTAGDMYWWISQGRDNTVMGGFADVTSPEDRWDLVNFVRLLTLAARSPEITTDIAPSAPFLPAIDFRFTDAQGKLRSLRDFEGRVPVLVVLARETGSADRYRELSAALAGFAQVNLQVVVVTGPEARDLIPDDHPGLNMAVVRAGTDTILESWSHYRRTARNPDLDNHNPVVGHMEFLVDRFGYVRARYRSDEGLFPSPQTIIEQVRDLAREPQLLPSPEEHIH